MTILRTQKGPNGDRRGAGHRPKASGHHTAQDEAARQEEVSEEDDGDPPHADGDEGDWRERYRTEMETRLGAGWETQPPGTLLAKLGWTRYEGLPTCGDPGPGDPFGEKSSSEIPRELWRDPVTRQILKQVCIFDAAYAGSAWTAADGELCALRSEHEDKEGLYGTRGLPDLSDARERLADMLPTLLRVKRRFWDPGGEVQGWGVGHDYREATLYCERWEKEGEDEGLWYFVARKAGQHIPREDVEYEVWAKVLELEGLTESHYSPRDWVSELFDD